MTRTLTLAAIICSCLGAGLLQAHSAQTLIPAVAIVDDNAPNDPGPNDPNISDPLEDGTPDHPFDGIGEAINFLLSPCDILVMPGTYREELPGIGNCRIVGSGRASTFIESPFPASAGVIESSIHFGEPAYSAEFELSNLTLRALNVTVSSFADDPTTPIRISLHEITMVGGSFAANALVNFTPMDVRVSIENADLQGAGVNATAGGLLDPGLQLSMKSVSISNAGMSFNETGSTFQADLESVTAPQTEIGMFRQGGGNQTVTLRDSVFGGATIGLLDGYRASLTADNVHFADSGVESLTSLLSLSVNECEFDHGGVRIRTSTNLDVGSGATATISKSLFHEQGVILRSFLSNGFDFSGGNRVSLTVDGNLFSGTGVQASVTDVPFTFNFPQTVDITVTNNVFDGTPVGYKLDYTIPDAEPGPAQPAFTSRIVNNTFAGCPIGVQIGTSDHVTGKDTLTTLLMNNVIAGGATGISIDGTDDHTFTIVANDVHGNSLADYSGDVPDQTGLNGNISDDPLFENTAAGDYHLTAASPCVDTGAAGPAVPGADHDGTLRPQDGDQDGVALPDIGAFEFGQTDEDGDGFDAGEDCDDTNPSVHPGAADIPGNAVDEDCSGAPTCDPAAVWKNHGQFVSCVVRACNPLVASGDVAKAQCDAAVSQAAHSAVGRRQRARSAPVPHGP